MAETSSIVIFGATGDLTRRKLVPALYNLCRKGRLVGETNIVGFARRDWNDVEFRSKMQEGVKEFAGESYEGPAWNEFAKAAQDFPRRWCKMMRPFDRPAQTVRR